MDASVDPRRTLERSEYLWHFPAWLVGCLGPIQGNACGALGPTEMIDWFQTFLIHQSEKGSSVLGIISESVQGQASLV